MSKIILTKGQADLIEQFKRNFKGFGREVLIKTLDGHYEIKKEFKVGDIVKDGNDTLREVAEVKENGICLYVNNEITPLGWIGSNSDMYKKLRHATDVEVELYKQRRFWQDNGREVWELKKGDVLSKDKRRMSTVDLVDSLGVSFNEFGIFANWHEVKKYYKIACFAHDRKDLEND